MQFYDSTNKRGIVDDAWFLIFSDSGDHASDFPLADCARVANKWGEWCIVKIIQASGRWEWDDTNNTDLPVANISLVANQQQYGVSAATFLTVSRVEAKDANGNGIQLQPFDLNKIRGTAENEFLSTAGTPKFYRINGSSLFLYPKPSYASTNAIRVFYQRDMGNNYFTATDTTKAPGFASIFHRIISYGVAHDYAIANSMGGKAKTFREEIERMAQEMTEFYANRQEDEKPSLTLSETDYGESALGRGVNGSHPDRWFF